MIQFTMSVLVLVISICLVLFANLTGADTKIDFSKYDELVDMSGGKYMMGTDVPNAKDGEGPSRLVKVNKFKIMKYPVTNYAFREFIRAKKYQTDAEKFEWSFVFDDFVPVKLKDEIPDRIQGAPWWIPVPKAYWREPEGKGSGITERLHYPVIHVSFMDAKAYCQWKGMRLPTEKEWEYAARGGLEGKAYPWGDLWEKKRVNAWQGKFPKKNLKKDGYHGLAPVDAFSPQNDYGMYDMVGNMWEWTTTKFGPSDGAPDNSQTSYALRGGSYIDSKDGKFNHQLRVTTRMGNTADAGSDNLGFRCAQTVGAKQTGKQPANEGKTKPSKPQVKEIKEGETIKEKRPNPADLRGKKKPTTNKKKGVRKSEL